MCRQIWAVVLMGFGLCLPWGCPGKNNPSSPVPPTFTFSPTHTSTITGTPTNSPTKTCTGTPTNTPTVTSTRTITSTPTITFSPTETATVTATSTLAAQYLTQWSTTGTAYGLAVDPTTGNVLAAEGTQVQVFTSSGAAVTTFGSLGTSLGQFNGAWGVVVDAGGNIYVSESTNNRIQKFDSSFNPVTQWTGKSVTGGSSGPFAGDELALDNAGSSGASLYAADFGYQGIQKFNLAGKYVLNWGGFTYSVTFSGGTVQPSIGPNGVAVDSTNHIYVAMHFISALYKFNSDGTAVTMWNSPEAYIPGGSDPQYQHIAIDASDNIYIVCPSGGTAESAAGRVRKYDSSGKFLGDFGRLGSTTPSFILPIGIAIDRSSGNIYVSDQNYIDKFSP